MIPRKFFLAHLFTLVLFFTLTWANAQDVQKVTITVGNGRGKALTFEPKQVTVKPGKVEFTLINKAQVNHNLVIKLKDKETPLVTTTPPNQTGKSEPVELSAGEYEIYCSFISGGRHRERGMAGKLIVR
jgi:plastocyanin